MKCRLNEAVLLVIKALSIQVANSDFKTDELTNRFVEKILFGQLFMGNTFPDNSQHRLKCLTKSK